MGIVVAIVLLLDSFMILPIVQQKLGHLHGYRCFDYFVAISSVVVGGWNIFWYALSYWPTFWAFVALLSGIFMVLSVLLLGCFQRYFFSSIGYRALSRYMTIFSPIALFAFFLLYSITIVRLNLAYPIIY